MPRIQDIRAEIIEIPLRHAFVTAQDSMARQVSRPVLITLALDDGSEWFGESVPVMYVTGETQESVVETVDRMRNALIDLDPTRLEPICARLNDLLPDTPTARAGIEMAIYNAHAGLMNTSLWRVFGGAVESVETDITLSIVEDAVDRAREAYERGFRVFKMKVGGSDKEADMARVIEVHNAVPDARIRLDANQGFEPDAALEFIGRVLDGGVRLELVEQPVPKEDLSALDAVAVASPVPVFADEAVKSPADALRLVNETQVQGINVKLMKSGIRGALDIIAIACAAGRKLMIGCMLESRRGIAMSLALACGTGAFEFVDLDSHLLLKEEGENAYFGQNGSTLYVQS